MNRPIKRDPRDPSERKQSYWLYIVTRSPPCLFKEVTGTQCIYLLSNRKELIGSVTVRACRLEYRKAVREE